MTQHVEGIADAEQEFSLRLRIALDRKQLFRPDTHQYLAEKMKEYARFDDGWQKDPFSAAVHTKDSEPFALQIFNIQHNFGLNATISLRSALVRAIQPCATLLQASIFKRKCWSIQRDNYWERDQLRLISSRHSPLPFLRKTTAAITTWRSRVFSRYGRIQTITLTHLASSISAPTS